MRKRSLVFIFLFVSLLLSLTFFSLTFASAPPGVAQQDQPEKEVPDTETGETEELSVVSLGGGVLDNVPTTRLMAPQGAVSVYETEPNDTPATANPLGGNTAVLRGYVYPNADVDYFSFTAQAGDRVYAATMTAGSSNGSTDSQLRVFDTDGVTVIEFDDDDGTFGGLSSTIAGATLPVAGTYYIEVRHFSVANQLRHYDLYFQLQSGAPTPETEPNDGGQPLPPSGWVSGVISSTTDVDIYTLSLNAGDTVYLSLDLDPERDTIEWNGWLGLGTFNGFFLVANDAGAATPDSEAFFMTVKEAGAYAILVGVPTGGSTFGTYQLSATVFPAVTEGVNCTTYTSTNVPVTIPEGPALVTSSLTVPGNPRIADLDVTIVLTHTFMPDLDLTLVAPSGNEVILFNDRGSNTQVPMNLRLDDEAGVTIANYTVMSGMVYQPQNAYRLSWFDGQDAGGDWTLRIYDDAAPDGGILQSWGLTICEPSPPPTCPSGTQPVTVFASNFEADNGGFVASGTNVDWAWGTPTVAPISSCNGGTNCWVTNLNGDYSASSNQDLLSPNIDLSGLVGPVSLTWAQKYQIDTATNDRAFVDAQLVGGGNPERLWQWYGANMRITTGIGNPAVTVQQSAGWGMHTADLSGYLGQQIELRFHLDSSATTNLAGLAIDDVTVTACQPLAPAISLEKTVGTDPAVCATTDAITVPAGTDVTYCYTVENTGSEPLGFHDLVDNELGTILSGFPYSLTVGASVFVTETTTLLTTTVNTATWTAYNVGPTDVVTATDMATVTIGTVDPPNIVVDPLSLSSSQNPDTQTQHTVTISNTGGSDLVWQVLEEPVAQAAARPLFPTTLPAYTANVAAEMTGLETATPPAALRPSPEARAQAKLALFVTGLLLVPDSGADRVMALDPLTGDVIDADFIPTNAVVGTGIEAILSASGDSILLSDQINDVVHEFDLDGNYLGVFAPAGGANPAIMDNIRGISLDASGNLLVSVASGANSDAIVMFDTAGNYTGNFIAAAAGGLASPFDVYGRASDWLIPGIDSDAVHRYDLTGAYIANLTAVNSFPEQVGEASNSNVLVANFSPGAEEGVIEYTPTGTFVGRYDPATLTGYRGVYELPNGNLLTTTGTGVHEIDRSGNLVQTKITGSGRFIEYVVLQTDCSAPADIPWASVTPNSGTTAAGASTDVTVTLDSTGLAAGDYEGNLCFLSDDPDTGPGNGTELVIVPVELTVLQTQFASIELTKTVGTDSAVCASTSEITVDNGATVYYCYEVTNTGDVPLPLHDLVDDQLGTLFTGFAYNLLPGESVDTVAAGLTISQTIYLTTTNTAVWTAYDGVSFTASDSASATVNVLMPNIDVDPLNLSSTQQPDTVTNQTLSIGNTGQGTLTWEIAETLPDIAPRGEVQAAPEPTFNVPATVTSVKDCAAFKNYLGTEPEGWAEFCGQPGAAPASSPFDPTSTGYTLNLRAPNRNLYQFTLDNFPGQTVVGPQPDNIYAMDFDSTATTLYALNSTSNQFGTLSTTTGAFTAVAACVPPDAGTWTGLSIDPVTDVVYASTAANLYTLDVSTCSPVLVGPFGISGGIMIDIAIGAAGMMYGHDIVTDSIYTINTTNGAATVVGPTGFNANFAQGMDFDNQDGTLYIFLYIGTGVNHYGTVNLATGAVTPLATTNPSGEFEGATQTVSGCASNDYTWLSVNPTTGTTAPSTVTSVDVTFDSTGLGVGTYTGQLCIRSNDPDLGPGNGTDLVVVPVTLEVEEFVPAPSISLTKTVGTDSGVCASTDEITVTAGTTVYYCYEVENTGNVTLNLHDLVDDELGTIFTSLPYTLTPGSSVDTVAAGLTISATLNVTTTNTATWTAYNAGPSDEATATASATVNVTPVVPAPAIEIVKTVGTTAGVCATTTNITVASGTTVYYCVTVTNTGNVALALHDLEDSELGDLFTGLAYDLQPGASVDTVAAGQTISAVITEDTTNTATWTAYNAGPSDVATATASATVTVTGETVYWIYMPIVVKP